VYRYGHRETCSLTDTLFLLMPSGDRRDLFKAAAKYRDDDKIMKILGCSEISAGAPKSIWLWTKLPILCKVICFHEELYFG